MSSYVEYKESPTFLNGGELRGYQIEALNWLLFNFLNYRCSLLADEMGLGKTLQTVYEIKSIVATN